MTIKTVLESAFILCLFFFSSGCMSIAQTMTDENNKIFIGTRTDIEAITYLGSDEPGWGIIGLVDLPFSLVMDTIFLPYTIPDALTGNEETPDS